MALEQAWSILKAKKYESRDEWSPHAKRWLPNETPHTKEEILDLLIEHGGIMGRMRNAFGTPEWSENMDDMESTGIFDSLTHHYGEQDPNASDEIAALQHGQWTQQDPPETEEEAYDPDNPTQGQQSFIDRATKNLREQQEGEGGE